MGDMHRIQSSRLVFVFVERIYRDPRSWWCVLGLTVATWLLQHGKHQQQEFK